ncbi:NEDD4-binding protein 2-like 2 [Lampris incognitus]|uniref:NEDD4-binding protein 2-like 2 n=1 Tax=Lampris incognitus TaxID=2546036 RepID=UPI0024B56D27|nr:NEDD4-binding protein 2-like 2 [Lampris incognitus]
MTSRCDSPRPPPHEARPRVEGPRKSKDCRGDCKDDSTDTKQTHNVNSAMGRVLKQVGSTSSVFIGPAFCPKVTVAESRIEETLNEFYKELEEIDSVDGTPGSPRGVSAAVTPRGSLETNTVKQTCNAAVEERSRTTGSSDKHVYKISAEHPSRPHWYRNEPYRPRRPTAPALHHWVHAPPFKRPPEPRFYTPPYCAPPPPFPCAHPGPPRFAPRVNHNGGYSDPTQRHEENVDLPPSPMIPPPFERSSFSHGFKGHSHREEWDCNHGNESNNVNVDWSQLGRDCDWRQRQDLCQNDGQQQRSSEEYVCGPSLALILMRGLPGSGKSTLARKLLSTGQNGLILSTDDYFTHVDGYFYDPSLLSEAHNWNQSRAKEAMHKGQSPVIIDNTNIEAWEMKPYVQMGMETGYNIYFHEPETSWKFNPFELEKKNKHGVPQGKLAQMMSRFSYPISVDIVMGSQEPHHVTMRHQPKHRHQHSHNQGDFNQCF